MDNHNKKPTSRQSSLQGNQPQQKQIDIERLADKVYRLMLADLRLARGRGVEPARKER